jgi:ribosomal-protein-alanine N-acetyltransferase
MYEYAKDRDSFVYTDGFPHEYDELKQMIGIWNNEAYGSKQFIRWGIELKSDKKIIGGIYFFNPSGDDIAGRRMDIGLEISKKYWNYGYAAEAIKGVTKYSIKTMKLRRVQAQIIPDNIASIRAFQKAGYVNEGTLRNYCHYNINGNCMRTMVIMACIPGDINLN